MRSRDNRAEGRCHSSSFLADGTGTVWWGEATDEPARADARPTENANCTTAGLSTRLHQGTFCETIRHRMKASVCLRMVLVAHFAIAPLPCPKAQAEWWEQAHDKWYLKDDWKAAEVEHYTPAFTMQNPA